MAAWRTFARLAAVGASLVGLAAAPATAPVTADAKAGYLARFAPFVVWPAAEFPAPNAPLVICVQGQDPFGPALERAVAGQSVETHTVIVRRVDRIDPDSGCHIAYLAGSASQSADAALKALAGRPVLTVTDADNPGEARGVVHLTQSDGRLQFAIDTAQAGQDGLSISSKLLALASEVKR